ncbi:MAG TPA: Ku protein [Oxalicibacterium sp.]|uniref:non-homologous end joining protein Ku n=1 Tax=Oxalicibacterium sp. TaxID=2766525 RepID=UPI002C03E631|nr:Ku protein [Oxalicibacterium sp.]HWU97254.1 Ku protein [Oxalicibacterium sp.]
MATTSKRVLWKGAISFGLVHIPIALYSATEEHSLNFDWLDKRTMDPVGYKRVNKKTGKEISKENIVKGIEVEDGHYVILTPEEIEAAYPKTTQTIEIESFVPANSIPFLYLERPYYIAPINKGAKVYALLREILNRSGKVGIAKVVIQTRQHLAVLIPAGPALVLNLLRWGDEIRTWEELDLPKEGVKAAGLSDKEIKMGEQLVDDMSDEWNPGAFTDSFKEQILHLVEEKIKAGDTESVTQIEPQESGESAKIYDLTEMLQRSLKGGKNKGKATEAEDDEKPARKFAPVKKTTVRKATAKASAKTPAHAAKKAAPKRKSA